MKYLRNYLLVLTLMLSVFTFVGCGNNDNETTTVESNTTDNNQSTTNNMNNNTDNNGNNNNGVIDDIGDDIEDGVDDIVDDIDGNDNDITTQTAEVTNSTSVMLSTVAQNEKAIGYVSLGSLSTDVKALKVDGVEATTDNIKAGKYKVARPFNLAYQDGKLTKLDEDFIKYIMSDEGQKIVDKEGYISVDSEGSYKASKLKGKITLAGST